MNFILVNFTYKKIPRIYYLYLLCILLACLILFLNSSAKDVSKCVEIPTNIITPISTSKTSSLSLTQLDISYSNNKAPSRSQNDYLDKQVLLNRILEYSVTYDAKSLPFIEPFLYSNDPEVRTAALNAVIVLGAQEGGQILRKASASLRDSKEAAEFLEKADYVELPPISNLNLKIIKSAPKNTPLPKTLHSDHSQLVAPIPVSSHSP